jgi:hypothetical protein
MANPIKIDLTSIMSKKKADNKTQVEETEITQEINQEEDHSSNKINLSHI